jgi:hypothetical protein
MFKESCWFLFGYRIGSFFIGFLKYHSTGGAVNVEFDWEKAMESKRLIGWYHTHINDSMIEPSFKDHKTMRSWVRANGRPMLCGIKCESIQTCYCFKRKGKPSRVETPIMYARMNSVLWGDFFMGFVTSEYQQSKGYISENISPRRGLSRSHSS